MASVHKRKLAPGDRKTKPFYVRFLDPTRPRANGTPTHGSKSFRTAKEAEAYKRKVETELESGNFVAAPITIRELCAAFDEWNDGRLADGLIGTARHVFLRGSIKNKVLPKLGAYRLTELTSTMLLAWYRDMVRIEKLAPLTAKVHLVILGLAFDLARRRGWFKSTSPTGDALKDIRGIPRVKVRTFSAEDMRRLIDVLQHRRFAQKIRPYRMSRSFVLLGAICGLRYGEIVGLKIGALDFERGLISIRLSITAWKQVKGPKTAAGVRDVPMPSIVAAELRAWMEEEAPPPGPAPAAPREISVTGVRIIQEGQQHSAFDTKQREGGWMTSHRLRGRIAGWNSK